MRVLGIDPSTRACGWAVLDSEGEELIESGCIEPDLGLSPQQKAVQVFSDLVQVADSHKPDRIFIEMLPMVIPGSGSKSRIEMAMIHGAVVASVADLIMDFLAAQTWRKAVFGRGNLKRKDAKAAAMRFISAHYGMDGTTHDEAEAVCIAIAGIRRMS
jgi:crossover junction endodeoxyribonuclease RuvC